MQTISFFSWTTYRNCLTLVFLSANLWWGQAQVIAPVFVPDLPLVASNAEINTEIESIYQNCIKAVIGTSAPSSTEVTNAINSYNNLNIQVSGTTITGNAITSYNTVSFVSTFAKYLKFNPTDTEMRTRATNLIWWVAENISKGTLGTDYAGYTFRNFARWAVFLADYVPIEQKALYLYIVEKNSSNFNVFWLSNYNDQTQKTAGTINTDFIYNNLDMLIPLVRWFATPDEQYRYMLTYKRYISRFAGTNTIGTRDGLKIDGCGFHHGVNYEAYMYAYNTVINAMKLLGTTSFQVEPATYLFFRNAIFHKLLISNDNSNVCLSMTGRTGNWGGTSLYNNTLSDLAIIGGKILKLATADPVLAGNCNRRIGLSSTYNYSTIAPFETGFYQMNHACGGVFRTNNTVIVAKGANNQLFGAEIYATENRFGRYQCYGALTVVYPGTVADNGFNTNAWDWNYNPGATTKVLPWAKLTASGKRSDEYQRKNFAGALAFDLKKCGVLDKVWGKQGIFAMDFQERDNNDWGGVTAPESHDTSFVFKKSSFFFDDLIVCLGSNISNKDIENRTVTTLYQNVTKPAAVTVNNQLFADTEITATFGQVTDNWVIDNFGTGYYILAGSGELKLKQALQSTPSATQLDPTLLNTPTMAALGYIDHGTNPINQGYEYVLLPKTNSTQMDALYKQCQNPDTKPYKVLAKNSKAHIVQHSATGLVGLALFGSNNIIDAPTAIQSNSAPCLIMYQANATNTHMKLSLSNPNMGLIPGVSFDFFPVQIIRIKLKGQWQLTETNPDISYISSDASSTTFDFATLQGLPIEANFEQITSSTTNTHFQQRISAHPIPTNNFVVVENLQSNSNFKIYSEKGVLVMTGTIATPYNRIDLSGLSEGIYVLSLDNGQQLKIIKANI